MKLDTQKALCVKADCKVAQHCQRALAMKALQSEEEHLAIVNPRFCTGMPDCPYFTQLHTVRYARGFDRIMKTLTLTQFHEIHTTLITVFGTNPYYKRRHGKYLTTPEEQTYIREVFARYGITTPDIFDAYEEHEEWI